MELRTLLLAAMIGSMAGLSCSQAGTESDIHAQLTRGPANAPVTILVFTEIGCPSCSLLNQTLSELLHDNPNEIRLVFKHYPQTLNPETIMAHEAALAAAGQGKFWEMQDLLMRAASKPGPQDLEQYADQLGLKAVRFKEAIKDHRFRSWIEKDIVEARALGVLNVPTLFINGRKMSGARTLGELTAVVQTTLGVPVAAPPTGEPAGFADLDLSRSPARGNPEAPVTIIEFSDYQCPYCQKATGTLDQLVKKHPGKIRWVFKNFPLVAIHPDALLAHRAALAAGEQNKYWEMHDLIFRNQSRIRREDLLRYAGQLGLDPKRFEKALDNPVHQTTIATDQSEGQRLGVDGTPTFFINGRRVVGALPYEEFKKILDEELKRLETHRP